jgi:hypothetical protein
MTLPEKLRLQQNLFNHFSPEDDTIPTTDLFNSIMDDLNELGFSFQESTDIMFTVKYERK